MLPTLSRLSVSTGPGSRLRHRCSSQYLRISPLHWEFRYPLPDSSRTVSKAFPRLSPGLSPSTYSAAYAPFTPVIPNNASPLRITAAAGTELAGASSGGTVKTEGYSPPIPSSHSTGVYDPKAFILHAALLRQAFAHCAKFPTAASRRSLGRVSVPVWPITLSGRLPIDALVSHYLANKLIGRGPLRKREARRSPALIIRAKTPMTYLRY